MAAGVLTTPDAHAGTAGADVTVLVTGAAGFVGGAVTTALAGAEVAVRAMVRNRATLPGAAGSAGGQEPGADGRSTPEYVVADLREPGSLRAAVDGVDGVVHVAALLGERGTRADFWETNVAGTERLLDAARAGGAAKFVFIGSPSALMPREGGDQVNIDESVPFPARFLNDYSETKAFAEQRVLAADSRGFRTIVLRPRAIWGPGDRRGPIVQIMAKLRAGKLPDLAPGHPVYASLCYIDHLVAAVRSALEAENLGGRSYFIADAEPVEVWRMLAELAQRFGLAPPSRRVPPALLRGGLALTETLWRIPVLAHRCPPPLSRYAVALVTRTATYDTSAAAADLGFTPDVELAAGLARFQAWVHAQGGVEKLLEGAK